jgi:Putative beta-lactamase-inhibitor-like, PepSY-like
MRLNLTLLFSLFVTITLNAQIRKIPADVTDAFKARYPHAERVEWKDNLGSFEAQFNLNNYEMSANFNSKGEWLHSERKMKYEELPASVKDGFAKSKYTEWEKVSAYEINKSMEPIKYRILVKKSGVQKKYLYFDTEGKLNRESLTL